MRIPWAARGSSTRFGRGSPLAGRRKWRLLLVPVMGMAVVCQLGLTGSAAATTIATAAKADATGAVAPNPVSDVDCNGWSPKYGSVRKQAGDTCVDPIRVVNGKGERFIDNAWYVGHDEPSVKFISSTPGSGNTMTYLTKIPVDPRKSPTPSGSVTNYGQLSVAPWFGLPMCDPKSYPQNPCTPDSDTNSGSISDPNAAGSAFMELQLYPPGYTPFEDSESCSVTKWCAAVTIDSLESTFNFANINANCEEPVNFAYLQTNGVPAGPPSPQLTDVSTFTPNGNTLMINGGDMLADLHLGPAPGIHHDDPRFHYASDRVHGRQRGERVHEHQHHRLLGHPVHLPRGVQHRQAAEPGPVGRGRGRRADGAGDRPLRGLQLGGQPGPVQHGLPGRPVLQRPEHLRHLRGRYGRPERHR